MADEGIGLPLPGLLREAIESSGLSVRGLAKKLAGRDATEKQIGSERRQLNRYLSGRHVPGPERARKLEKALGLQAGMLTVEQEATPRLPEQLARLADEIEALRDELGARLAEVEAEVGREGSATTRALRALAKEVRALEHQLGLPARQAKGRAQ